jgi:aryl-alcohol dehydrogenase-like predicted oxidoreductase
MGGWMWGGQDQKDSLAAIRAALESGINWIDTAPIYGGGESEICLGKWIKEIPTSQRPLIFSKFGLGANTDAIKKSASKAEIIAECEQSLKRLNTEIIDLYQLHWPVEQSMEEVALACQQLQKEGKVEHIGVCNFNVDQLKEWKSTGVSLCSVQNPYSILRNTDEKEVLPYCSEQEMGYLAYSPLLRGLLFGQWDANKTFPEGDGRATHKDYSGARFERHIKALEAITELGSPLGLDCAQMSLATILSTQGCTAAIVGARNEQQGAQIGQLYAEIDEKMVIEMNVIVAELQRDLESL